MISINSNVYGVALGHYKYYLRIGRIGENCVGLVTALPPPPSSSRGAKSLNILKKIIYTLMCLDSETNLHNIALELKNSSAVCLLVRVIHVHFIY